jgi:hypothetical protein
MIDAEAYVYTLTNRDITALTLAHTFPVTGEVNVDVVSTFPCAFFDLSGNGQSSNGDDLWSYTLNFNVLGDGLDQAKSYARALYRVVRGWDSNPASTLLTVAGDNIWVSSVSDIDAFSRLPSPDVQIRNAKQYTGAFALELRNN